MTIDLDAYFARIGYAGSRAPTLQGLQRIIVQHTQSIPFENFDPLLRRRVLLGLDALENKLVRARRGGYCFEQNALFKHVLERLGFRVSGLAARVRWNQAPEAQTARSHMLLRVDLAGKSYLVDVGFGGLTLTAAIELRTDGQQDTPHGPFRLQPAAASDALELQALLEDSWQSLYRFTLEEQYPVDYEVSNHYTSTHPDSHFLQRLMLARTEPGRRYGLSGNAFRVHRLGQAGERRRITDAVALRALIAREFALPLPEDPEVEALLARIAAERD